MVVGSLDHADFRDRTHRHRHRRPNHCHGKHRTFDPRQCVKYRVDSCPTDTSSKFSELINFDDADKRPPVFAPDISELIFARATLRLTKFSDPHFFQKQMSIHWTIMVFLKRTRRDLFIDTKKVLQKSLLKAHLKTKSRLRRENHQNPNFDDADKRPPVFAPDISELINFDDV